MAKPYSEADSIRERSFERISEFCELLHNVEKIIDLVYECYDEEQQHAELIVRIPHMLGYYYNNPEKSAEIKINFSELYRFYTIKCMPEMQQRLQRTENSNIPISKLDTVIINRPGDIYYENQRQLSSLQFKSCFKTTLWIFLAIIIAVFIVIICLNASNEGKEFDSFYNLICKNDCAYFNYNGRSRNKY
jgi:hypothetical protein